MPKTSENKKHWKPCTKWGGALELNLEIGIFTHICKFSCVKILEYRNERLENGWLVTIWKCCRSSCYSMLHSHGVCISFILYHRYGGVFRRLRSLRELACRPISWGSWLTLSEYDWGVQSPPKCKVFRFHETIPEKVIDWIPLGIRCEEKEDLRPKTVLRQG